MEALVIGLFAWKCCKSGSNIPEAWRAASPLEGSSFQLALGIPDFPVSFVVFQLLKRHHGGSREQMNIKASQKITSMNWPHLTPPSKKNGQAQQPPRIFFSRLTSLFPPICPNAVQMNVELFLGGQLYHVFLVCQSITHRIAIGSMYGMFTYMNAWFFMVNVGKYTIHGS